MRNSTSVGKHRKVAPVQIRPWQSVSVTSCTTINHRHPLPTSKSCHQPSTIDTLTAWHHTDASHNLCLANPTYPHNTQLPAQQRVTMLSSPMVTAASAAMMGVMAQPVLLRRHVPEMGTFAQMVYARVCFSLMLCAVLYCVVWKGGRERRSKHRRREGRKKLNVHKPFRCRQMLGHKKENQ